MPAVMDWVLDPLALIDQIYEECEGKNEWQTKVEELFHSKLQDESSLLKVPIIPETPLHQLQDGQLVRFKCLLQDQYDPEYFVETYKVEGATGAIRTRTSRYREIFSFGAGEKLMEEEETTGRFGQRCVGYCITVPGQNDWVTQEVMSSQRVPASGQGGGGSNKRSLEQEEQDDSMDTQPALSHVSDDSKRVRSATDDSNNNSRSDSSSSGTAPSTSSSAPPNSSAAQLNFPIDNNKGIACLVKFYTEELDHSITDMLDVIGIVCLNPSLAAMEQEEDAAGAVASNHLNSMADSRGPACHMPPSLVPRLHALVCRRLPHPHPLLAMSPPLSPTNEMKEGRELLREVLEEACLGDPLAGDYVISNMLGSIYSRQDLHVLGQFPLNISGIVPALSGAGFTTKLYDLLQQLTTHSHLVPLTTHNLNTLSFIPKKDYSRNELQSGLLQLAANTLLVLDETAMEAGQLQSDGLHNLEQVSNVMRNQKCKYDFLYHKIEMDTDINILVLSEGRSMLQCESEVVLCPQHHDVAAAFERVQSMLTPDVLNTIRKYITIARLYDYELSQDMQQELQNEFVEARLENKNKMSAEMFHELLVLARLVAISCGEQGLSPELWRSCKILEVKRTDRIKALNRPTRAAAAM